MLLFDTSFKNSLNNQLVNDGNVEYSDELKEKTDLMEEAYQQRLQYFEDLVPDTKMEKLTTETVYTRPIEVYLVNP